MNKLNLLIKKPELNIWLCLCLVSCVCHVWCPLYGCDALIGQRDNCTVYSTCVHTAVATHYSWKDQENWHEHRRSMVPRLWPYPGRHFFISISGFPTLSYSFSPIFSLYFWLLYWLLIIIRIYSVLRCYPLHSKFSMQHSLTLFTVVCIQIIQEVHM